MKLYSICMILLLTTSTMLAASISYLHPLPNSHYHSTETTVIVRFDEAPELIDPNDINFQLIGRQQQYSDGAVILSSDRETIIFKPNTTFTPGDTILLSLNAPALDIEHSSIFYISPKSTGLQAAPEDDAPRTPSTSNQVKRINGVSVPSDFPNIHVTQNAETADGFIFVTTYDLPVNYWMILKNDGTPYFYQRRLGRSRLWDFSVQADSLLTLIEGETAKTFDSHFEQIDWFKCGHGYKTDYHEFRLTPEGHVLLIGQDIESIDMSKLVDDGKTNARVVGNLVQELDSDKNVIFEWRTWDHYNILDSHLDSFTSSTLHYAHINAIDIDYDGNLLISARTMDEITKVNRRTGQVMWRLGGARNDFTFVNDPDGFYYQHDIRAVPDNPDHYTLFDNGNYHSPKRSRAVEYQLDIENKTATTVWQHRQTPDYYSHWMGSVQRLPNGNTGICWALKFLPNYMEVDASGQVLFELDFEPKATSYRARRFQWQGRARRPYLLLEEGTEAISLIFNQFGADDIAYYNIYADTLDNPVTRVDSTNNTFIHLSELVNEKTYYFRVTSVDSAGRESEFSNQQETFVQIIKPGENQIVNGDFSQNTNHWLLQTNRADIARYDVDDNGRLNIQIFSSNGFAEDVQVSQRHILLGFGRRYRLEFDAYADQNRSLDVRLMDDRGTIDYSELGLLLLTKRLQHYSIEFTMRDETDKYSRLFFSVGDMVGDVYIDNVFLSQVTDTDVADNQIMNPKNFELYPAYPNPFNAQTTIRYVLGQAADVQLTFFDILGRNVFAEEFKSQQSGHHTFQFDAQQLSSGVYFCQIRVTDTDGSVWLLDRTKVMLLK